MEIKNIIHIFVKLFQCCSLEQSYVLFTPISPLTTLTWFVFIPTFYSHSQPTYKNMQVVFKEKCNIVMKASLATLKSGQEIVSNCRHKTLIESRYVWPIICKLAFVYVQCAWHSWSAKPSWPIGLRKPEKLRKLRKLTESGRKEDVKNTAYHNTILDSLR